MPASIIAYFVQKGLSQRAAKIAAWVAAALAAIVALGAIYAAFQAVDYFNDRDAVEKAVNKANVESLEDARKADDKAARQAEADQLEIQRQIKEARDAIDNAEGGKPSAAAIAHNCQRLRNHGFKRTDLPEPCRSGAAAGGQAAPDG